MHCNGLSISIENIPWYKQYRNLCYSYNLKQLIRTGTRTAKGKTSLLDHILTNTHKLILESGVIDVGISDHQLIYCTRKKHKEKLNQHRTFTARSYKNYSPETFCSELKNITFPNYLKILDINEAFDNFSEKLLCLVNKIAPLKSFRVRGYNEDWFDGEKRESIRARDKLLRKYKKTKLEVDYDIYKEARNRSKYFIKSKKVSFYRETLRENAGDSKRFGVL